MNISIEPTIKTKTKVIEAVSENPTLLSNVVNMDFDILMAGIESVIKARQLTNVTIPILSGGNSFVHMAKKNNIELFESELQAYRLMARIIVCGRQYNEYEHLDGRYKTMGFLKVAFEFLNKELFTGKEASLLSWSGHFLGEFIKDNFEINDEIRNMIAEYDSNIKDALESGKLIETTGFTFTFFKPEATINDDIEQKRNGVWTQEYIQSLPEDQINIEIQEECFLGNPHAFLAIPHHIIINKENYVELIRNEMKHYYLIKAMKEAEINPKSIEGMMMFIASRISRKALLGNVPYYLLDDDMIKECVELGADVLSAIGIGRLLESELSFVHYHPILKGNNIPCICEIVTSENGN